MSIKVEKEHLYQQVLASINANSDSASLQRDHALAFHLVLNGCDSPRVDSQSITKNKSSLVIHSNVCGSMSKEIGV